MPRAAAYFACAFGALLIFAGLRLSRLGRESRSFTRTSGRVLAAHVEELPGPAEQGGPQFRPVIRYAFEARGRAHESEQLSIDASAGAASSDAQEARRWVDRHPAGTVVDVWFDPADPRRSVLVRGDVGVSVFVTVGLGLALAAVGLFALARR